MEKHIIKPLFFVLLISVLSFACCEEECDDPTDRMCPNFDVCLVTPKADASFVMLDSSIWSDTLLSFSIDTISSSKSVYFRALNKDMAAYEWTIGTDPTVFTDNEFKLSFNQFEGFVNVRLVVTAKDDYGCLDAQELRDTSYQTFQVLIMSPYDSPIFGEFIGSDTAKPNENYTLTVLGEGEDLWHSSRLFGLPSLCDYPIGILFGSGYDWFVSHHDDIDDIHCRNTIVIGRLQEDRKTLEVEYFYDADDGTRIREVFVGTRI